jgi:hypothetical protein
MVFGYYKKIRFYESNIFFDRRLPGSFCSDLYTDHYFICQVLITDEQRSSTAIQ